MMHQPIFAETWTPAWFVLIVPPQSELVATAWLARQGIAEAWHQNRPFHQEIQCDMLNRHGEGFETSPAPNRNGSYEDRVMASKAIRPIRVEGNFAYVPLTQGHEAVIDAQDVPLVSGWNWCAARSGSTFYAIRRDNRAKTTIRMHRVIMGAAAPEVLVDHRDGNGLNNVRKNIRVATKGQNNRNVRTQARSKSGFKGVTHHAESGKWRARIRANGALVSLGLFKDAASAHDAYCRASAKLHGGWGRPK
jgi:hypothetical protein